MPPPSPTTNSRRRLIITSATSGASLVAPGLRAQGAQDSPNKPIRIILPFTPGGSTDALARAIGQKLQEQRGQPTVVDNRPGAAGSLGITQMAKMLADGYTIAVTISNVGHGLGPEPGSYETGPWASRYSPGATPVHCLNAR